jgi:GH43 family beta-xylosidase
MRLSRAMLCCAIVLLAACSGARSATPVPPVESCTFTNPIGNGADPWVIKQNGTYYSVESASGGIWVYRSNTLTRPKQNGVRVWTPPDTGWNRTNVWAPELHFIDGQWYIYYTAGRSGPPFIAQRAGVLAATTGDPQGTYADRGKLYTGDSVATGAHDVWAIDLTVHKLGGVLYAVWSGWLDNAATDRTPQHLYMARMSNPWTISSNRVRISSPTADWERGTELDLQEGPEFLEHDGHVFIVYSTRESWLREYKLGLLRLRAPMTDPMNPDSNVKTGPVFTGTSNVYGVGHASFTMSPDDTENWIVYHSKVDVAPGWNRVIRAQKFAWNADGSPQFGVPTAPAEPVRVPSGQCTTS